MITAAGRTAKSEGVFAQEILPPPSRPRKPRLSCVYSALWHLWLTQQPRCLLSEAAESVWNWNLGAIFAFPQRPEDIQCDTKKCCVSQTQEGTFLSNFFDPPSSSNLTLSSPSVGDSQAALRRKSAQTCLHSSEWKVCVVKSCRPSFQRAAKSFTDGAKTGRKRLVLINTRKTILWQNNYHD